MTVQTSSHFGGHAGVTDQEANPFNDEGNPSTVAVPQGTSEENQNLLQQSTQSAQSVVTGDATQSDRQRRIRNGVQFLRNPSVRSSTLQRRVAFLEKKGLSIQEIYECFSIVSNEDQQLYTLDALQEVSRSNQRSGVSDGRLHSNNGKNVLNNMGGHQTMDTSTSFSPQFDTNQSYNNDDRYFSGRSGGHPVPNNSGVNRIPQYQQQSYIPGHDSLHSHQYMLPQPLHHINPDSLNHRHEEIKNASSGIGWKDIFIYASVASVSAMGIYELGKSLLPYEMIDKEEVKRLRKSERERDRLLIGGPKMAALMEMRKAKFSQDKTSEVPSDDVNPTITQIFGSSSNVAAAPDIQSSLPNARTSVAQVSSPTVEVGKEQGNSLEAPSGPTPSTEKDKNVIELEEKSAALEKCRREKAELAVNNGKLKAEINRLTRALEKSQEEVRDAQCKIDKMVAESQEENRKAGEKEHDQKESGTGQKESGTDQGGGSLVTPLVDEAAINKPLEVIKKKNRKGRK